MFLKLQYLIIKCVCFNVTIVNDKFLSLFICISAMQFEIKFGTVGRSVD